MGLGRGDAVGLYVSRENYIAEYYLSANLTLWAGDARRYLCPFVWCGQGSAN